MAAIAAAKVIDPRGWTEAEHLYRVATSAPFRSMLVERSNNQEGNLATEVFVAGSDLRAKIRNPWGVFGLSIITLGIYTIFWWYYVNRELRDLGQAKRVSGLGDNPWLSTAAYIAGGFLFYIPTIWTIVTTTRRIQAAHRVTQQAEILNGWLAALVWIFTLGFGGPVFTQYQMNRLWNDQSVAQPVLSGASAGDGSGVISEQEPEVDKAQVLPGDSDQKGTL